MKLYICESQSRKVRAGAGRLLVLKKAFCNSVDPVTCESLEVGPIPLPPLEQQSSQLRQKQVVSTNAQRTLPLWHDSHVVTKERWVVLD